MREYKRLHHLGYYNFNPIRILVRLLYAEEIIVVNTLTTRDLLRYCFSPIVVIPPHDDIVQFVETVINSTPYSGKIEPGRYSFRNVPIPELRKLYITRRSLEKKENLLRKILGALLDANNVVMGDVFDSYNAIQRPVTKYKIKHGFVEPSIVQRLENDMSEYFESPASDYFKNLRFVDFRWF